MNILPLVISFIILFSYLCTSFFKETQSLWRIEKILEGYNQADKKLKNAFVKRAYDKIQDKTVAAKTSAPAQGKSFRSKREHMPPLETSKFYLRALTQDLMDPSQHPLYEPLAQLLRQLYQHCVFKQFPQVQKPEYALIKALVKKAQQFPAAKELSELHPDEADLQKIYYKMLKGTNRYTEEVGIPPLAHFLSLEPSNKAIHVRLASIPILKALFTEPIAQKILLLEEERWKVAQKHQPLSPEEFNQLCGSTLQPYLSYSGKAAKRTHLVKRDDLMGIGIEKSL